MREIIVLVLCAACGSPRAGAKLPEPPGSLAETAPRLVAGEQTAWTVFYQSVPVGRAELIIDDRAAHTVFRASRAARLLSAARLSLTTALERGRARGVREELVLGRTIDRAEATIDGSVYTPGDGEVRSVPGGTRLHTAHSALGVVRAWSAGRAPAPGYLWLWSGGQVYRLDVSAPAREDTLGIRALRVDGTVRAPHLPKAIAVSVWLAANRDRTPIRFSLVSGSHRLAAEVVESTASLEAR